MYLPLLNLVPPPAKIPLPLVAFSRYYMTVIVSGFFRFDTTLKNKYFSRNEPKLILHKSNNDSSYKIKRSSYERKK